MKMGFAWVKVFEWWAGQTSTIRYGIPLACLGLSAAAWFEYGRISLWGFATGFVLLIAALVIRD